MKEVIVAKTQVFVPTRGIPLIEATFSHIHWPTTTICQQYTHSINKPNHSYLAAPGFPTTKVCGTCTWVRFVSCLLIHKLRGIPSPLVTIITKYLPYLGKDDVSEGIFQSGRISIVGQETRIVVIVQECSQHGHILKDRVLRDAIVNVPHTLLVLECIGEFVVHRVVESGREGSLVTGHVLWIAVEHFTDGKHASRLRVLGPKLLRHLRRGVNSNPIKAVC